MYALLTILSIHLVAVATPGPDFFYVSQTAAKHGRRKALMAVLGTGLGTAVWTALAVLGLAVLMKNVPILHNGIAVAGGSYLIWMGLQAIRASFDKHPRRASPAHATEPQSTKAGSRFFGKALFISLSNPKSVIYFGSIFSLLLNPENSWEENLTLWFLLTFETTLWFALVATLFSTPRIRSGYTRCAHIIDRVAGGLFMLLGGRIFLSAFRG